MCTSIYTKTTAGDYLLSRTMDFSYPLDPAPVYIPKGYSWTSSVDHSVTHQVMHPFIGAGRKMGETYFVADGVNEHGIAAAELYLPGDAVYQKEIHPAKQNLAPHEMILWILGNVRSIEELEQLLPNIVLIEAPVPELNIITPLHWIVSDDQGRCVVIEPTEATLRIKENPVGVMTNTPLLEWHINNLRNYLNTRPQQYAPVKFGDFEATPFSQGTGTLGLPGGYTPPERFIRAAFFKEHIVPAKNEAEGVRNAYHILDTVRIPKGIVINTEGASDYSLYAGSMCTTSRTYYYNSYDNHQIAKVVLDDTLKQETEPVVFDYPEADDQFITIPIKSRD